MLHIPVLFALLLLAMPAMAADINQSTWSETDANNNAAPPAGWPANMAPNQVEPSARAMMGATKRWYDRINAAATSGGSANTQTLTYSVAPTSLVKGDVYRFTAGFTNTGPATINVNSLGAKAIQVNGAALAGGEIFVNKIIEIVYDGTQFQLNPTAVGGFTLPMMATTDAVKALSAGQFPAIFRLNNIGSDGVSQMFLWSATPCSTGGNDISQIAPTAGTGCWVIPSTEAWAAPIHQNSGGSSFGHTLVWADQNLDMTADHFTIQSYDPSLITYIAPSGTYTAGEKPGVIWVINSVTYTITALVHAGDTAFTWATRLGICLGHTPNGDCDITPASPTLTNALLALNPKATIQGPNPVPAPVSVTDTRVPIDVPWGGSACPTAINTASTTITVTGCTQLDNGPYIGTARYVAGRTPVTGDQLGTVYLGQSQSGPNSGIDTQYALLAPRVLNPNTSNPEGELLIGVSNAASAKFSSPSLYIGTGVSMAKADGSKCPYTGLGSLSLCGMVTIDSVTPGTGMGINFRGAGTNLWEIAKDLNDHFVLYDFAANNYAIDAVSTGSLSFQNGTVTITSGGAVTTAGALSTKALLTNGHVTATGAGGQSLGSGAGDCGTSPSLLGNDTAGRVTVGSGTNGNKCTITFASPYSTNAPVCSVANETSVNRPVYPIGTTTSALAITGSATLTAGDKLVYRCSGIQ